MFNVYCDLAFEQIYNKCIPCDRYWCEVLPLQAQKCTIDRPYCYNIPQALDVIIYFFPTLTLHVIHWTSCACEYTLERLSKGTCTCTCNREYPHNFCVLRHQFCSVFSSTRSEKLVEWRPLVGKNLWLIFVLFLICVSGNKCVKKLYPNETWHR